MAQTQREAVQRKMKDLLQGIHTKVSGRSGRGTEGSKSSLTNSAPRSIPVTREVAQLARQGWGTKTPLTTQACTEVRKYKLLDQEIVMPIMRGKIQAILTTDAALLYGLGATLEIGGEEWKYGERWTIRLQASIQPNSR